MTHTKKKKKRGDQAQNESHAGITGSIKWLVQGSSNIKWLS